MNQNQPSQWVRRWIVGEWSARRLFQSAVVVYGLVASYVFFRADSMIFLPPAASYSDSAEILKIKTTSGLQLSAQYWPTDSAITAQPSSAQSSTASNVSSAYVLLYSHGNAEDLGMIRPVLESLNDSGAGVFAYDYPGYGTSEGVATEQSAYEAIEAAYDYLVNEMGFEPDQIVVHGRSVGGGPATYLAARYPVGGLILESTFTSAFRTVIPVPVFPFDKFPNRARLDSIDCPVLIIHGMADTIIPPHHGQHLLSAASDPKQAIWIEQAGHNDLVWQAGDRYPEAIREFLQSLP